MIFGRYLKWYAMVTGKGREEQMQRACERQFNLFGKERLIVVGLEAFQKIETVHQKATVTHKDSMPAKKRSEETHIKNGTSKKGNMLIRQDRGGRI